MDESEVIVQAACSVSLSTEGSIIPFTPGDVYLCAGDRDKGESGELWCLVVLHKRNFPRKYSIARQLTKTTVRKRGSAIGFIVIEFDDTNQVRLKDFSSDAAYIAQVLEFCFANRTHPSLVDLLRAGDLSTPLPPIIDIPAAPEEISNDSNEAQSARSSPSSSKNSSFGEKVVDEDRISEYNEQKRLNRTYNGKRSVDSGCITPPVRCIASIEETRVINEATVENIPERETTAQQSTSTKFNYNQYHQTGHNNNSNHKYYQNNRYTPTNGYLNINGEAGHNTPVSLTPPLQSGDIFTNISSPPNGTTPPREFFVSVLDPNNCQADITVEATDSPEKIYQYHSEENFKTRKVQMQRASDIMRSKSPLAPPHTPASLRTTPPPPSPPPVSRSPEVYTTAPQSPAPYIEESSDQPYFPAQLAFSSPPHQLSTSPSQPTSPLLQDNEENEQEVLSPGHDFPDMGPVRRSKRRLTSSAIKYTDDGGLLPLTQREKERRRIVSEGAPTRHCKRNKLSLNPRKSLKTASSSSLDTQSEPAEIPPMKTENLSIQQDFLNDFSSLIGGESINGGEPNQIDPETFINSLSPKSCKSEPEFNGSEFLASVISEGFKEEGREVKGGEKSTAPVRRSLRPRSDPPPPYRKKDDKAFVKSEEAPHCQLGNPTPHGFVNLGNTCYMNCVLQCVLTVPSFTALLHTPSAPLEPTLYNCLTTLMQCKLRSGGAEEAGVQKKLLVRVKSIIADATNLFKGSRQQDAHEFLGKFLDVLREERQDSLKCPVARSFQCEVVHTIRCSSCRGGGQKVEQYYDFSLNLPPESHQPHNLGSLLDSYFATDLVEYVCGVCGHGTAQVQHRFSHLPETLVLHVQRYAFSRGGSREGKRQDSIDIPPKLDITRLSWDSKDTHNIGPGPRVITPDPSTPPVPHTGRMLRTRPKGVYSLHAVISHLGESRECGHYICDVKEGNKWHFFDDVNMHKVDSRYVREKRKNSCYIFFYLRDDSTL